MNKWMIVTLLCLCNSGFAADKVVYGFLIEEGGANKSVVAQGSVVTSPGTAAPIQVSDRTHYPVCVQKAGSTDCEPAPGSGIDLKVVLTPNLGADTIQTHADISLIKVVDGKASVLESWSEQAISRLHGDAGFAFQIPAGINGTHYTIKIRPVIAEI